MQQTSFEKEGFEYELVKVHQQNAFICFSLYS
jgi:hypothetical protein